MGLKKRHKNGASGALKNTEAGTRPANNAMSVHGSLVGVRKRAACRRSRRSSSSSGQLRAAFGVGRHRHFCPPQGLRGCKSRLAAESVALILCCCSSNDVKPPMSYKQRMFKVASGRRKPSRQEARSARISGHWYDAAFSPCVVVDRTAKDRTGSPGQILGYID